MRLLRRVLQLWFLVLLCPLASAQNRLGDFTFTSPPGWAVKEQGNQDVFFPGLPGDRDQVSVTVTRALALQANPEQFVENFAAALSEGSSLVSQEPAQSRNTPSDSTLTLKSLVARSARYGQTSYVLALVQGQDSAVLLLLVTPDGAAQKYLKDFTGMLTSLRFTPRPVAAQPSAGGRGGPLGLGARVALPEIKSTNAAQFVAAGGDPDTALIPDEFRCYQTRQGDGLTPELTVQILPGGQYRTAYGGGTLKVGGDGGGRRVQGVGGPLAGANGFFGFNDFGQSLTLQNVGEGVLERPLNFKCYQRGPRENAALFDLKLNTPKFGKYPCLLSDGGNQALGTLELLAGGQYRLGGGGGRYAADIRSDQARGGSQLTFSGGPLDNASATYSENESGIRRVSLRGVQGGAVNCQVAAKPAPPPSPYGAAKAPTPPRGSGGLDGNWVHRRTGNATPTLQVGPDLLTYTMVMNSECPGDVCWEFAFFDKNGYVYTGEPDVGLDETDCTCTHPNGLPLCEVYRVQGGKVTIGDGGPQAFKQSGDTLTLDGRGYTQLLPLTGLKLAGAYRSRTVTNAGPLVLGGASSDASLTFSPGGQFAYDHSSSTNLAGVGALVTASGKAATSGGTYAFQGNTLTLTYRDGGTVRLFAATTAENGKPSLKLLRLGGATYAPDDAK